VDNLKAAVLEPSALCPGCEVAKGFMQAATSLQPGIEAAVAGVLRARPGSRGVVVTGHSLGAAMAALLLANQSTFSWQRAVQTPVYTFGQPRVGNAAFAEWFSSAAFPAGSWFRVVHHDDPVPHLPTPAMGFAHVATELWYAEGGTGAGQSEVCDGTGEDLQCSAGTLLSGEITDHLTYLTHPICGCVPSGF
jgi:predicted lipase